jgi:formate dehydrogenase (NADP+) beta subunit
MSATKKIVMTRGAWAEPGSSLAFKTGTWRVEVPFHQHSCAPCHGACPAGEDAQAWIARIQEHKLQQAWEELVAANPLPAITGRVCPHPCETSCNRGSFDEAIAIHDLERFIGDAAIKKGWGYPLLAEKHSRDERIAVVGAGPAGLSCAYQLVRRGYPVTVFDALPEAGGLLRSAIPMTRLPRDVLNAELARLFALGVDFRPRQQLGRDVSLEDLEAEYNAVFLAPGCQQSRGWDVDGATPPDLHEGLHLIREWLDHGKVPTPASVVIHGGGNTAVDLARIMKRAGVAEVSIITASGLPGPDTDPDDVLNVVPREFDEAVEEGIVFYPHHTIKRLIMRGSQTTGVEIARLKKIPGAGGRKKRIAFEGTERVIHADMVIPAIGETVDPAGLEELLDHQPYFRPDDWGRLQGQTTVLVGGDARGDRGTVSAAIGDGRKAALAIAAMLDRQALPDEARQPIGIESLNLNYFAPAPRAEPPKLKVSERTDQAEIIGSLSEGEVFGEADRCLSCGNCLACDNCWNYCPDNAVLKTVELASDGSHYVFDFDYCKGCGLCARECPTGYIRMRPEE